ncbi:hypothetical protein FBU31_004254 [Coemansia sp. 'formosensis']|nr:hypothetical protein FBU31_004254 [Coemansia sp. 'formosensis']
MWRRCALVVTRRRLYSTQVGFGALGVDSRVVSALETEFGITAASAMQAQLLRATDAATDNVLVRQHTGSGKTLAVAAGMLSLAVREHDALRSLGLDEASALAVQQANTVVVVPNRELAFQIEGWISRLLAVAYPQLPRARVVGRFVSGAPYEAQQRGVLRRHGVPAIVVGTPRCLLELAYPEEGAAVLALRAPELLQVMAEKPPAEWAACAGGGAEALRGVRRLVLDEVDGMLRLPNRHATERQKQLRKDKPKPGQVFVDRLLATLHVTNIAKALRPPPPPTPTPPASNARGWQKAADRELARGSLAPAPRQQQTNIVSGHSLQIVAVSATANKDVRNWMVHRGWMTARPLMIDNDDAGVGVPAQTTHHCLVIENDRAIRNLRPRDSSRAEADALKEEEEEGESPAGPQPLPMMEQMAEVAANVIHELRPRGSVVIFTRSDASTAQFGRVLEAHGVVARDIMTRFDAELGQQIDAAKGKAFVDAQEKYATTPAPAAPELHVFLATEEAARGLDLPDASLVLILDIPKSVASYAHLAGRTARFGQPGTVVTVVPVGRLGWFESKMRGIYAALNITPKKADFIQH